jgi:predicted Rossmann fold flavoprotein
MTVQPVVDVLVVGGGASGLMAALQAAEQGASVQVVEQMRRPGLKLLASGGGHCNFTRVAPDAVIMQAFGPHGRFMAPALAAMGPSDIRAFFRGRGLDSVADPDGCVFPADRSARSVLGVLLRALARHGVPVLTKTTAEGLTSAGKELLGIATPGGKPLTARAVVLAAGGRSHAELGGNGGGYALAVEAGHRVSPPVPGLVPLVTEEPWPRALAGVSLPDCRLTLMVKGRRTIETRGPLLFTHRGVSGPAALDISGSTASLLGGREPVVLGLRVRADDDEKTWTQRLRDWRDAAGGRRMASLLHEYVPAAVAEALMAAAGVSADRTASRLTREETRALTDALAGTALHVADTEGFDHAMVTRGGVALREVRPESLESRLVHGLFFAGEILDLDGPCGGFNLQWAFSSGVVAGRAAAAAAASRRT